MKKDPVATNRFVKLVADIMMGREWRVSTSIYKSFLMFLMMAAAACYSE